MKRKVKTVKRTNLRTAISFAVSPLIFVSSLIENEDLCEQTKTLLGQSTKLVNSREFKGLTN